MVQRDSYISREIERALQQALARGKSVFLLGPRQTGKTTLISHIPTDESISLIQPGVRQHYERNPSVFCSEVEALAEKVKKKPVVAVDEVQLVPELMDVVQDLIDRHVAQFILTGSSARKLRRAAHVNFLPGRVINFKLSPLSLAELTSLPSIHELLHYGSLPGIMREEDVFSREVDLTSYVSTYLEEEIRAEAVVRNLGAFGRFMALAASESGNMISMRKLSEEIGVSHSTISSYYQILEDCLIIERVDALVKSKVGRNLMKSPKYLFYDLGIRRLSAREGVGLPEKHLRQLFEQFIGLELIRYCQQRMIHSKVYYWRDRSGPEIDWILEREGQYIPIEVKWTTMPKEKDARHLQLFLKEYENSEVGYIVCRVPLPCKIAEKIYAIPWQHLADIDELLKK